MTGSTFKKGVAFILTCALFVGAWHVGWLHMIWEADKSYLSAGIFGLFLYGWYAIFRNRWDRVEFAAEQMPNLGLIGTVVGFIMALMSIDPAVAMTASGAQGLVTALISGMGVALYTTLVGSVGYIWLALMTHLFDE